MGAIGGLLGTAGGASGTGFSAPQSANIQQGVTTGQVNQSTAGVNNSLGSQQALLAALASVDLVALFTEQTPVQLIEQIRPDIYVKGGDYEIDALPETRVVKTWGGKAVAIPFIYERSTTTLLGKIRS